MPKDGICKVCGKTIWRECTTCKSCRMLNNNLAKGLKHTAQTKQILSETHKGCIPWNKGKTSEFNERHPFWKGDNVGFSALHEYVRRRKPEPEKCELCGKKSRLDLANKSDKYLRDLNDWEYLCRRCHMLKDKRLSKMSRNGKWAMKHEKCCECGTTKTPHRCKGLCIKCYWRKYNVNRL